MTIGLRLRRALSVSPEIVAAREDFFNHGWTRINTDEDRLSLIRVHPCSSVVGTYWLRLRRAALYRRFLTCQMSPAGNVLPITNRRYGRLKICATLNRYVADRNGRVARATHFATGSPADWCFGLQMGGANVKNRGTGMRTSRVKNHLTALMLYLALAFGGRGPIQAEAKAIVELSADLLDAFGSAQVTNASSCELRRPASAGGVKQDALFEHPAAVGRPARVSYSLNLPAVERGQLLLFVFDIGIADGARLGEPADGVRFEVELEGEQVFANDCHECRWQAHAVEVSRFAGRRVLLALLTDAIKNTSYDWAVWGNPRVLLFRGLSELKSNAAGKVSIPITTGALALNGGTTKDLKVFLKDDDGAAPVEWRPLQPRDARWRVRRRQVLPCPGRSAGNWPAARRRR